jgi:ribokinase
MIIVFGSLNADLVLSATEHARPGETVVCDASALGPGGKGNNQAVAAARAGAEVAMVGRVGDDALGTFLIARLAADRLDASRVRRTAGAMTGCASVAVDRNGENVIYVASGANALARADDVDEALLARATTLVCQMEVPAPETFALLARARRSGKIRTVLNFAPARDLDGDALDAVRQSVDVLVVNHQEATRLAAHFGLDATQCEADEIARHLARSFGAACILTLGPAGVRASDGATDWAMPALAVDVVDTTGAGDTFVGVLAAMLDEKHSLPDALRRATVAASLACRHPGAQEGMPDRREIERHSGLQSQ